MRHLLHFFLLLVFTAFFASSSLIAQNPVPKIERPVDFYLSPPLSEMIPSTTPDLRKELNKAAENRKYPFYKYSGPDPVWQKKMGTVNSAKGLSTNFAGTDCLSDLSPSDANGDIGPNHYVQAVNAKLQVFDRTGISLWGPENINTLFSGVAGGEYNSGDPIVLYDQVADRWMISEISLSGETKYLLIAVSTSPDPLGSYYCWSYSWGAEIPDFPKFGIWNNSYLLGLNCNTSDIVAFDRTAMLDGNTSPQLVTFDNPWRPNSGLHTVQPCDNDGEFATAGTPGVFVTINDDAWGGSDELWIYDLTVDWAAPETASFNRTSTLAVASFDSNFGEYWDNIPQPGTDQRLELLSQVLMYRVQYRNFGSYQSIVCCHDVDVSDNDHAGIRWYELRNTGDGWSVYQQGTYAPDGNHRWMGSISQNSLGEIALGFSAAGTTQFPSICYTGRLPSDYLGDMTFAEQTIFDGTQSQTDGNRWGDYSSMSVDPSDNKTFWYTSQYAGGSSWNWHTRIAAFKFDQYCAATSIGCDEYISQVQLETIDNSSGCDGYSDFSDISTDLTPNSIYTITVTNGNPFYYEDQCGIWIDWNNDNDFDDADETITVNDSPGVGPYTASISVPFGINSGPVRMRVRIVYTEPLLSCGETSWGEVEDYTINVISYCNASSVICDEYISRVQLGTIDNSTDCSNYANYTGISTMLNLTSSETLTVTNGNLSWDTDQCGVWIDWNRDFDFDDEGETIVMSDSPGVGPYTALITPPAGTTPGPVRMRARIVWNETPNSCGFQDYGEVEDYTIILNGVSNFWTGSVDNYWHNPDNWSLGHIPLENEDAFITNLGFQPVYVSDNDEACNSLMIQAEGSLKILENTLTINGNLYISGQLEQVFESSTINIKGDWNNYTGESQFIEGPGRVIFSSPGHQYINCSENFNILEANMGAALRVNNVANTVTCNQYAWTSGGIDVLSGTFTAIDLFDSGLFGTFWVNAGGELNLNQDFGQWTDLQGEIHIFGGTMTVTGGDGESYWPYGGNATIEMSDGILDFRDNGIYLYDNGENFLSTNITGGTIKTNRNFTCNRIDFNPTGGTIELYGASDAYIGQYLGSTFNDVKINKAVKSENGDDFGIDQAINSEAKVPSGRKPLPHPNTKSNSVIINDNLSILGSLTIETGNLDLNSFTVNVTNDVNINSATLTMTNPTDKLNCYNIFWNPGSTDNVTDGEFHVYLWYFNEGTDVMLDPPNTAFIKYGIFPNDPDATFGNLVGVPLDNQKFDVKAYYPIRASGDFTIQSGANWWMSVDFYVNGIFDIQNNASLTLNGTPTGYLDSPFQLNGTFSVDTGNVICHGQFSSASTSSMVINGGSFISDSPNHPDKGWEYLNGNLTMLAGLFEITHNSIKFGSTATTNISGGTIRTGGAFSAKESANFLPTGGVVEVIGAEPDLNIYCGNGNYFYNLLINRTPGFESFLNLHDIIIKNDLTIQSGILNSNGYNITIEGNWTNNVGAAGFVEGSGTVTFAGAEPKDILTNESFNNLTVNKTWAGTGGVEIPVGLTVNVLGNLNLTQGTLQLDDNSTLNVSKDINFALNAGINAVSGPGINISVGGNWTNNNTAAATANTGFYGGTSTVTFNGSADQVLNTSFTSESFYNLNVNKPGGQLIFYDVLKIGGNLQVITGICGDLITGLAHELSGNLKVFATGEFYPKGNFTFTGGTNTTFENLGTNNSNFVNARLNKTLATNTLTQLSPVQLLGGGSTLNVDKGILNLNGNYFRVVGNVNINNGGKIAINSDAWLEVGSAAALNVNTGGTLEAIGTAGHPAKVTHHAGFYTFNVNSGGTISANNALFEYTGTINGLNVKTGATVNATNCFHNCTFQNGDPSVANAALLTIDNNQTFTVNNASFPAASTAKNVAKNVNAGHVTFNTATGAFAGAAFEKDPNNLIDWTNSAITHTISLPTGWSGLSSYVMPSVTNLPTLFTPIAVNFTILQTLAGVYYPAGSINTIGTWASKSAYSVKMNAAASLPISGNAETNKTFALGNGWNLMPVICNTNVTTSTLVGGLGANLNIIKEIAGSKVYWPAFGIYTLNQLTPGKAYYVRMAAAGSVTFPANATDNGFIGDEPIRELATPWNNVQRNAGSHIFAIEAQALANLSQDDIIGIFTPDGICAGNIQIVNTSENLAFYAFADDQLTTETDGFTDGQPMNFKLFRPSTGEEFNLEVVYSSEMPNNDGLFETEGISAIKGLSILNTGLTENYAKGLYIYPNPTNGKVSIGGITGIEQILVMASDGTVVMRMNPNTDGNQVLDLSALPAGFYQVQIRTSEGVVTRKVVKGL